MKEKYNEEFYKQIDKIKIEYENNPKKVVTELKNTLNNIEKNKKESRSILKDIDFNTFITVLIIIIIILIGLINIESYYLYLFGVVFFLAGLFIGLKEKGAGLIFLLSHGCTGMVIMIASQIQSILNNPLLQDISYNIYIYLGIGIILIIIGIVITVLHNLSDNLKKIKWIPNIVLGIFTIVYLMVALFPHIIRYIYSFKPF